MAINRRLAQFAPPLGLSDAQYVAIEGLAATLSEFVQATASRIAHEPTAPDLSADEQRTFRLLIERLARAFAAPGPAEPVPGAATRDPAPPTAAGMLDGDLLPVLRDLLGLPPDARGAELLRRVERAAKLVAHIEQVRNDFLPLDLQTRVTGLTSHFHARAMLGTRDDGTPLSPTEVERCLQIEATLAELLGRARLMFTSHDELLRDREAMGQAVQRWADEPTEERRSLALAACAIALGVAPPDPTPPTHQDASV